MAAPKDSGSCGNDPHPPQVTDVTVVVPKADSQASRCCGSPRIDQEPRTLARLTLTTTRSERRALPPADPNVVGGQSPASRDGQFSPSVNTWIRQPILERRRRAPTF